MTYVCARGRLPVTYAFQTHMPSVVFLGTPLVLLVYLMTANRMRPVQCWLKVFVLDFVFKTFNLKLQNFLRIYDMLRAGSRSLFRDLVTVRIKFSKKYLFLMENL